MPQLASVQMRDFGSRILKRARKTTPDCKTKQKNAHIKSVSPRRFTWGWAKSTGRRTTNRVMGLLGPSHLKPPKTIGIMGQVGVTIGSRA